MSGKHKAQEVLQEHISSLHEAGVEFNPQRGPEQPGGSGTWQHPQRCAQLQKSAGRAATPCMLSLPVYSPCLGQGQVTGHPLGGPTPLLRIAPGCYCHSLLCPQRSLWSRDWTGPGHDHGSQPGVQSILQHRETRIT